MPGWLEAGLWGWLAGSALLLGAVVGLRASLPRWVIADLLAFGAGTLISALAFDVLEEAYDLGGLGPAVVGFVVGALLYLVGQALLARFAGGGQAGLSLALGGLLDGIPESIAIGVSLLGGGSVGIVTVIAVFVSNVPEALASAADLKKGRSSWSIILLWGAIALVTGVASIFGYAVVGQFSDDVVAAVTAVAAGAILVMLIETMIPDAVRQAADPGPARPGRRPLHGHPGLFAALGFLVAFVLTNVD